jgi:hypothetical protein
MRRPRPTDGARVVVVGAGLGGLAVVRAPCVRHRYCHDSGRSPLSSTFPTALLPAYDLRPGCR